MRYCKTENHTKIKERLAHCEGFKEKVEATSKIFSLLGDETRMKIVLSLMEGELCVFHICEIVEGKQSAVSQHLRKLKDAKIVKSQKVGNQVLYSIADDHIYTIVKTALRHKDC